MLHDAEKGDVRMHACKKPTVEVIEIDGGDLQYLHTVHTDSSEVPKVISAKNLDQNRVASTFTM